MAGTGSLANTDLGSHKLPVPLDALSDSPILLVPFFQLFVSQGGGPALASVISSTRL
jgi:hypothetical protein